jgi:hypothetical protein
MEIKEKFQNTILKAKSVGIAVTSLNSGKKSSKYELFSLKSRKKKSGRIGEPVKTSPLKTNPEETQMKVHQQPYQQPEGNPRAKKRIFDYIKGRRRSKFEELGLDSKIATK